MAKDNWTIKKSFCLRRRNFSLVARYSLKFTRCLLLVVKSLITCCKIRSLLVAEVAPCKKSLLLVAEVARRENHSLLVAKFARYSLQKLLVAKNHLLLVMKKNPGTNVYLKPIKLDEFYLFVLYFQLTKNISHETCLFLYYLCDCGTSK